MASTRQVLDWAYRAMAMNLAPSVVSIDLLLTLRQPGTDELGERFIFTVRREEPDDD